MTALAALIAEAYRLRGLYFREEYPLQSVVLDTYNLIMEDHPGVTLQVIREAFHNGIKGRYGDVAGLPPIVLAGFVESWYKSRRGVNMPQEEDKPTLQLQRDTRADSINLLQCLYDMHVKQQPILIMPADIIIRFLWSEGMMLDLKDKDKLAPYIVRAAIQSRSSRRPARLARSMDEDSDGNVTKGFYISREGDTEFTGVTCKAYELAILDFFDECAKKGIKDMKKIFTTQK